LMDYMNRKKGFKLSVWMILFLKLPPFMPLWNYGMSRLMVAVPLLDQGLHLRPSPHGSVNVYITSTHAS
jgi:hypothetical protein